jgi:hypothetical protein
MAAARLLVDTARAPGLSAAARASLEAAFGEMRTLEDVVRWGLGGAQAAIVEVVVQDEYTHDVVVKVSAGECYAVFDTT